MSSIEEVVKRWVRHIFQEVHSLYNNVVSEIGEALKGSCVKGCAFREGSPTCVFVWKWRCHKQITPKLRLEGWEGMWEKQDWFSLEVPGTSNVSTVKRLNSSFMRVAVPFFFFLQCHFNLLSFFPQNLQCFYFTYIFFKLANSASNSNSYPHFFCIN